MDDVRGLSFHIDAIKGWMDDCGCQHKFDNISSDYIDRIYEVLNLLSKYDGYYKLEHHLAVLLGYYIDELLDEMAVE